MYSKSPVPVRGSVEMSQLLRGCVQEEGAYSRITLNSLPRDKMKSKETVNEKKGWMLRSYRIPIIARITNQAVQTRLAYKTGVLAAEWSEHRWTDDFFPSRVSPLLRQEPQRTTFMFSPRYVDASLEWTITPLASMLFQPCHEQPPNVRPSGA